MTKAQQQHLAWMLEQDQIHRKFENDGEYARKILGISKSYYSEIKSGKKSGARYLPHFSKVLNVSIDFLLGIQALIPIRGEISKNSITEFMGEQDMEHIDGCSLPGFRYEFDKKYYALRITDNSLVPAFRPGEILIVERDSFRKIENFDHVIYNNDDGSKALGYIEIIGNEYQLRSFSPGDSLKIPQNQLSKLEVITTKLKIPQKQ